VSSLKKRIVLIIFIVFLLCNSVIPLYLNLNSQKKTDIAIIPSSPKSLIIRGDPDYIFENQTFTSFTFSGNATYLFKNCSFDCDDLDFVFSVKVTFQNCTIIANKFHTGIFTKDIVPTNYSVEINLTQSSLIFRPAPLLDILHHTDFVFLGTSVLRIENTNIHAPFRQLEPHEDAQIILHNSLLDLQTIEIFERGSIILENSTVKSNMTLVGDIYDITPPHNSSLSLNNSRLSGTIWNFGVNSTVTIQNSTVDLLVKTLWVGGSTHLKNSEIISGSSNEIADFNIDEKSSWGDSQYIIIGLQGATIQVESSVIYGLACNESKAFISNSYITDFISGAGLTTQISAINSTLSGKGYDGQTWGVLSPFHARAIFYKWTTAPSEPFFSLINCTINGTILLWTETVILQNCQFLLGQWNDTIIASSNEYLVAIVDSEASQYLTGNTSIDILAGTAYQIAETTFSINNALINTTAILDRTMDYFSIFGGSGSFIQSYLHYTYDFTTICGLINFSIMLTNGYDNYTHDFTLDSTNNPWCFKETLPWPEILLILVISGLIGLLLVGLYRMKESRGDKKNRRPPGDGF